jgi:hypothetical protein
VSASSLAIPWTVVTRFVQGFEDAQQALRSRFPNVPEELLEQGMIKRLVMLPRDGGEVPDIDLPGDPTPEEPSSGSGGALSPSTGGASGTVFGFTDLSDTEIGHS